MSDESIIATIKSLAQDYQHQTLQQRREELESLVEECAKADPSDFSPELCKAVWSLVLTVILPHCQDSRDLQWHCLSLVSSVGCAMRAKEDKTAQGELCTWFCKLAKKEVKAQRMWKPKVLVPVLQQLRCWIHTTGVVKLAAEVGEAFSMDALTALMGALYGEMSRCDKWPARWRYKSQLALKKLLEVVPKEVLEHSLGMLKKDDPAPLLVSAVSAVCLALPDAPHRAQLIELYMKQVVEAKQPLSDVALEAWGAVVASMTTEDLEKSVLPAAVRFSKRQPASIAQSLPMLASQTTVDMSPHAKLVLDPFAIDLLKVQDKRPRGRALVQEVVRRCNDVVVALSVAEAWAEALRKAGKADEKQALLLGIAAIFSNLTEDSEVNSTVVVQMAEPKGPIAKAASEDASEDNRALGCKVLGAMLCKVAPQSADPVVNELLKSIADKKAADRIKVVALDGLSQAVDSCAEIPWVAVAAEKVVPSLLVGVSKPGQRLQSLLAWSVFAAGANMVPEKLEGQLKKEHLSALKDGTSFLNIEASVLRAPTAELASQAQLWRAILAGHIPGLPAPALEGGSNHVSLPPTAFSTLPTLGRTAILLLTALHRAVPDRGEQPYGSKEKGPTPLQQLGLPDITSTASGDSVLLLLVQTLVSWLAEIHAMPAKDRPVSAAALRSSLLDLYTVAATVAGTKPLRPETLALLMLATHHPLVATAKWSTTKLWRWVQDKGPLKQVMQDTAGPALKLLLSDTTDSAAKLPSTEMSGFRRACVALVTSLNLEAPMASSQHASLKSELHALAERSVAALHTNDVEKELKMNIAIFFHPEGSLWAEEGAYLAEQLTEDVTDKSAPGNKFLKGIEDDVPMEAPKPAAKGKAKAKGKADAKGKAAPKGAATKGPMSGDDIKNAKIQEQSEIRARIRTYVDEADFALDLLIALASHDAHAEALSSQVSALTPQLLVLLQSPLTTMHAKQAARALARVLVPESAVPRRDMLPEALQVVSKTWFQRTPAAAGTAGELPACDIVLERTTTTSVVPAVAFNLLAPVVLRPLLHSGLSLEKVCTRALDVLEKQLLLGAVLPESMVPEVFDCLGTVLLTLPTQRAATQAALQATCRMLVSTEEQLGKLSEMFFSEEDVVRTAVMTALAELGSNPHYLDESLSASPCHAVLRLGALESETARTTLEELGLEADGEVMMELLQMCKRDPPLGPALQELVAKAVSAVLTELEDVDQTSEALDTLMQYFREDSGSRVPVAKCMDLMFGANLVDEDQIIRAFRFLLRQALGITSSGSEESIVQRDLLLAAGMALIKQHGKDHAERLFSTITEFETSEACKQAGESANLGVAVFLGALSEHLAADHPRVAEIPPRLIARLTDPTSTKSVQDAIVKVMPPLMKQNKEQANEYLVQLIGLALAPSKEVEEVKRRGAAMGLGAVVKGLSIQAVGQHGILKQIQDAAENKKDAAIRQGALLCLEGLTLSLGRLFDPYVVHTLPLLLQAFSDSVKSVQACSKNAASAMMANLSGPGVKQVLKPLLEGIQDKQWRTKLGSIELLAAMSSCLPKQLAQCLPQVVPALCTVINDQHAKVKEAAREALDKIGSIITSPELKALATDLIEALTDGAQFEYITSRVLDQLLATSFVHRIDAPSLSLVCPLVQRALRERSSEMKRKGAQIVGSMVLLIRDPKDFQPYLPLLLPQLKETLKDPIPDVRATTAKAFGTLANGLPEDMLGDVLPWLFQTLRSTESSVERSGAAHGLSEVMMAMGTDRIETLLPDILNNASNQEAAPEVKEGYLGLFVFLPGAMGSHFEPHIVTVLNAELQGIADDTGAVRDTAYKAAQVLVKQFGSSHTSMVLPAMQEGVFDTDWRIRHASVQLMGQLMEQILRAHRIPTNSAELMQVEAIPKEWRQDMLASLYIVKSDENAVVKQACAQVWKQVVQNTPRTLKELLPALMRRLIASLASESREKQRVAARCVGDLVGKLGDKVMPELMPIFMDTLQTGTDQAREGVCIGLAELINATTKQMLAEYLTELIPAIRRAIIDEEEHVRNSASVVVALLHREVGGRATTEIVTWVLEKLQAESDDDDLDPQLLLNGLEQLMSKQHALVLPLMLERLVTPDGWTEHQLRGLSTLAVVQDSHTIHTHLSEVLPVLIEAASSEESDEDLKTAALESASRIVNRVEQSGITQLCIELTRALKDGSSSGQRLVGAQLLESFVERTELNVVEALPLVLPAVLPVALADTDEEALVAGIKAFSTVVKKCKKEELAAYLQDVRQHVFDLVIDPVTGREDMTKLLPGLCRLQDCAIEPLYPIYHNSLNNGTAEQREIAAESLGELVNHTTPEALKQYAVKITGPLIRIVGDRFPGNVKKAILNTLKSLLIKGGQTQRPFWPQLQTTYLKCVSDPAEAVRLKAAESLGTLARVAQRTEQLAKDLCNSMKTHAEETVRQAMCISLGEVLLNVPQPTDEEVANKPELQTRFHYLKDDLVQIAFNEDGDEKDREVAAWALAVLVRRHLTEEGALEFMKGEVSSAWSNPQTKKAAARVLGGACWVQETMPVPGIKLCVCLQGLVDAWLPVLLKDSDQALQAEGAVLLAATARLAAEVPQPWESLKAQALVVAGSLKAMPSQEVQTVLQAVRHYAVAASKAGINLFADAAAAPLLEAVLAKELVAKEVAEQAVAALLELQESSDQAAVQGAVDRVAPAAGAACTQALRGYIGTHTIGLICAARERFDWDF